MNKGTVELLETHFDTAFAAPVGIRKLRTQMLTLAMQGKLVPQDPQDQHATERLQTIEAVKEFVWRTNHCYAILLAHLLT